MADTVKIGNLDIDKFYLGDSSDVKIYIGEIKLYPKDEPQPIVRYAVTDDISTYQDTTYVDVYSMSDDSWYKKNNLNKYEEYGVYDIVENISSATTYDGKLAVVGTTEYQYSGGSWSVVGTYEDDSVTYTIDDTRPSPYVGQELATTFKIPYADVDALGGRLNLRIITADGVRLDIRTTSYRYSGSQSYKGTVTNDGEYYYFALPSEAPQSIIIDMIDYFESTPIHLIVGSKQVSVEYVDVPQPDFYMIYDTVSDMEDETDIYVGKYGQVGNTIYKYDSTKGWVVTADKLMTGTTVSNIRSSQLYFNAYNSGAEKFYVNGSQTDGVYNWVFHNENSFSAISFDDSVTDNGLVNFDFLTLEISQYTTISGYLVSGKFPNIRVVNIPPSITAITNSVLNITSNNCPVRINIQMTSDLATCYAYWSNVSNSHIYIQNGIILGEWMPISNAASEPTIHVPSSAVTRYRNDTYARTYIPFIELTDNGTADLSYSYYIRNYNNGHKYEINFTDTVITGNSITNNNGWSSLYFGSNITSIENNAFRNTNARESIPRIVKLKFDNGLTSIGEYAFSRTNASNLESMPNRKFIDCTSYGYIDIPDSVTTIGKYAFYRGYSSYASSKERIVIGSGITSIGDYAFGTSEKFSNVDNEITCKALTPPTLGTNAFYDGTTNYISAIYVPAESVDAYKSATNWSTYADRIQAIPT